MIKSAIISDDGFYRYYLSRRWDEGKLLPFVMLNPSTADHENDDPTIRRCIGFARREGYSGIEIFNLFAFRSTDPKKLNDGVDPFGSDNEKYIREMSEKCIKQNIPIIVAWGGNGNLLNANKTIMDMIDKDVHIFCLGKTKDGNPKHPLYIKSEQPLIPFINN